MEESPVLVSKLTSLPSWDTSEAVRAGEWRRVRMCADGPLGAARVTKEVV